MNKDAVVLAELWRGGYLESAHCGHVAVVGEDGELIAHAGDPHRLVFARSAWKPFQALAVVESGAVDAFGFTDAELAVCAASHHAEDIHVQAVSSMLQKLGMTEADLRCGAHAPYSAQAAAALLRSGRDPSQLHSNCSGKHTGMLAAAKQMGADASGYLALDHPVQQYVFDAVCDVTGMNRAEVAVAVDGCGVPVFGVPLAALARAYACLADPDLAPSSRRKGLRRVRDAMMAHPEMVSGTDRFNTRLMQAGAGEIVAKLGAEGVFGIGLVRRAGQARAFAVKVQDGASRAVEPAVCRVLQELAALDAGRQDALSEFAFPVLRNVAGTVVGKVVSPVSLQHR
ncbi:MAG: asparaginase [Firmicutes bacterium]|nr:asparaginase [Bacillota bacterium]